jgi:hypothetical protein
LSDAATSNTRPHKQNRNRFGILLCDKEPAILTSQLLIM